jgi:hypothetical protein
MLALLVTLFVGGAAALFSYIAWRWALSMLVKGRAVGIARLLSMPALGFAGLPLAYTLGVAPSFARPVGLGALLLLLLLLLALAALVLAAFRDECIRRLSGDQELAEGIARLDHWERAGWLRGAGRQVLPSFTGTTRQRTMKRAAIVAFVWTIPIVLFHIARS